MATNIDARIRARIEDFTAELTDLIHEAALAAVQEALGGAAAPTPTRGRKKTATRKTAGPRKKAAARKAPAKSGKRVRRTAADLEATSNEILAHVKANPGSSMEALSSATGEATKDLRRPVQMLVAAGALRTTGQRRGTKYFPGSGAATKAAPRTNAAKRRATKKKTTKRRAAKKSAMRAAR